MRSHWISTREISKRQIVKTATLIFAHPCELISRNDDLSDRQSDTSPSGQGRNCIGVPRGLVTDFQGGPPFSVKAKGRNSIDENSCPTLSMKAHSSCFEKDVHRTVILPTKTPLPCLYHVDCFTYSAVSGTQTPSLPNFRIYVGPVRKKAGIYIHTYVPASF